jgi:ferritin
MRPLISDKLNSKLDEIVTYGFYANRVADRIASIIGTKFVLNNTEEIFHKMISHLYPLLSDDISTYQANRNNLTFYGATPADNSDYPSPLSAFEKMLEINEDYEALITEVVDVAIEEQDLSTKVFLERFLLTIIPITAQLLLFVDKLELYGDKFITFDNQVRKYILPEVLKLAQDHGLNIEGEDDD